MPDSDVGDHRPRLTLITGEPGSGKSTLGTELSRALSIPFLARDDIRRGLYFTAGAWTDHPGPVPSAEASVETFLRVIESMTALGVSLVAEYVVRRDRSAELDRLRNAADCAVIVTKSSAAPQRFRTRHVRDRLINRRPVLDALGYASAEEHTVDAVERMRSVTEEMRTDFDLPTLVVDTDGEYSPGLDDIIGFVTGASGLRR